MDLTAILNMLGIEKLDESKQNEIKTKLTDMVQLKISEGVKDSEEKIKETLTEKYEEKFETYKQDITEKFSGFVDEVIDEELKIPEEIVEYARIGKKYQPIIEKFKVMLAIDEGLMDDEAKELLGEAKQEIEKKVSENDKLTSENMELKSDARAFAAEIYLRTKCDELTLPQKEKAMSLLEGVTNKEEIDRKINIIIEAKDDDTKDKKKLDEKEDENLEDDDINENSIMNSWVKVLGNLK